MNMVEGLELGNWDTFLKILFKHLLYAYAMSISKMNVWQTQDLPLKAFKAIKCDSN